VHGIVFELAAALFNVIWWYARRDRRLLASTIDAAGVRSITRRFLLGLAWIGGGTLLGALLPLLGVAMFASFTIFSGCRSPVRSALPGPARYKPASGYCPPRPARNRNLARTIPLPASNEVRMFVGHGPLAQFDHLPLPTTLPRRHQAEWLSEGRPLADFERRPAVPGLAVGGEECLDSQFLRGDIDRRADCRDH